VSLFSGTPDNSIRIGFRVDASPTIGSGHVMRCLALADELKAKSGGRAECFFIVTAGPGNLAETITGKGFACYPIEYRTWQDDASETLRLLTRESATWLVVDHYQRDEKFEHLASSNRKVFVIDDLADRFHDCDILLDQNVERNLLQPRYTSLVPARCELLLGPQYALLREEFRNATRRVRSGKIENLFVFFGSGDASGECEKALKALSAPEFYEIKVCAVLGALNPKAKVLKEIYGPSSDVGSRFQLEITTDRMALYMQSADFAMGAGGTSSWERCFLGLPSINVQVADNQRELSKTLASRGAIADLGWHESVTPESYRNALNSFISNPIQLESMSKACLSFWPDGTLRSAADMLLECL
jgi:UDP-2,4-diacetamido-2,4,6-trideoxy-beta-L-altropyranose hydrolase